MARSGDGRDTFQGEGNAAPLLVMAADDRLNTDQTVSLSLMAGSTPFRFPGWTRSGHWREVLSVV